MPCIFVKRMTGILGGFGDESHLGPSGSNSTSDAAMSDNHVIDMQTAADEPKIESSAQRRARENIQRNRDALGQFQPELIERLSPPAEEIEWLFARDGYLTGKTESVWWSGCSVPLLTGRQLLKRLELTGSLGCFLSPSHAGQVRACFEKIQPAQAVVVVLPKVESLWVLLHCDDFSAEIAAGRLFFAAADEWGKMLAQIFEKYSGLALPQQFVRTALLDDAEMAELSAEAQTIISRETDRRANTIAEIIERDSDRPPTGSVLVLAASRLNLADLSNIALRKALVGSSVNSSFIPFDPENPLTSSPLSLAEAATNAGTLVAADLFRADLPGMVGPRTQWITWATRKRIAPASSALPGDRLILADPQWRKAAIDEGWKPEQIQVAGWPLILSECQSNNSPGFLAILTDLRLEKMPQRVTEFSSQRLLWEYIEDELARNPQALGADPDWYLNSRIERLNIGTEGLDRAMFFEKLIEPAYVMGLARLLIRSEIPLRVIGRGWDQAEEFNSYAFGAVESAEELQTALADCRVILPAFPRGNSLEGLGLAVVRANELSRVKRVLISKVRPSEAHDQSISREIIRSPSTSPADRVLRH
jgi:hypothetical protein